MSRRRQRTNEDNVTHINSISCGQGAPSLYLIIAAGEGVFPADVVITADTGWENDMLWSTGERTTAREYWERVTKPLAESYGFGCYFTKTKITGGGDLPDIPNSISEKQLLAGSEQFQSKSYGLDVPFFGSEGGRLKQSCTFKWKITAIRQQMRLLGATTATTHLGLTMDEVHRVKQVTDVKWEQSSWPLIESKYNHRMYKGTIRNILEARGIPYLLSTECDGCPHKNAPRWLRTSQKTLNELAEFEARFDGQFFLTKYLVPLPEAIELMKSETQPSFFDACDSGYCFT